MWDELKERTTRAHAEGAQVQTRNEKAVELNATFTERHDKGRLWF